jgi:hypothetical protein
MAEFIANMYISGSISAKKKFVAFDTDENIWKH